MQQYLAMFTFLWKLKRLEHHLNQNIVNEPSLLKHEMKHFVNQLQNYIFLQVVETGWQDLEQKLKDSIDLDQIIQAHDEYLHKMTGHILFRKKVTSHNVESL
jgi:gamma-tubulin complex component 3